MLTVGVGLGATVATIALARAVLVDPLPYAEPERLAWIYTDNPPYRFRFSVVDYRALEADHPTFSAVAAYQNQQVTVADGDAAERVAAKSVTGSYFPLLGQKPHIGRLFDPSDDARDDRIVVLTYAYWARRFGRDPSVLGRAMTIDGARATVVGVLQRTSGPLEHDVALFSAARWPTPTRKGPFFTTVLGRLRPGVSATAAAAGASRHQRPALSDLAVVVPGREGHVGARGSEDPGGRRSRLDAGLRAGGRSVRAADRLRQRGQSADRPQPASQP